MYNAEYKQRFIEEKIKETILPKGYLNRQFERVSEMEEELDKDISSFTFYEIIEYYKLLNTHSIEFLKILNSYLSSYTQWCLQQNLVEDGQNHFLELRIEDYNNCVNKALFNSKVVNKKTLELWVNQMQNPRDQYMLLGLFEGIKGKDFCELLNLKPEDVDDLTVKLCTGRTIKISKKLKYIIEDCIEEDRYYCNTGRAEKVVPLVDRGFIFKDYPNTKDTTEVSEFQRGRQAYNALKRMFQYIGVEEFTANQIYESGKLNMIKEHAQKLGMNCTEFLYSKNLKEIEDRYDCTIVRKPYIMKYKDYLD